MSGCMWDVYLCSRVEYSVICVCVRVVCICGMST